MNSMQLISDILRKKFIQLMSRHTDRHTERQHFDQLHLKNFTWHTVGLSLPVFSFS